MLCGARPADRKTRRQVHPGLQHGGERRRQGDRRRQRARDPRAAVGCEIFLRDRPEDPPRGAAAEIPEHRLSREARHAMGAHRTHRAAGRATRTGRQGGCSEGEACRNARQGRLAHRRGRRIPRIAGADGEILRRGAGRGRSGRACLRGSLQAAGAGRSGAGRSGVDCRCARRQDRHPGRLLGDRREADRIERPLCAAAGGAGCHSSDTGQRVAFAAAGGSRRTRRQRAPASCRQARRRAACERRATGRGRPARLLRRSSESAVAGSGRAARSG